MLTFFDGQLIPSVWAHMDLDAFYCQVLEKRDGIDPSRPTCAQQWNAVIAVNYKAREYGVKRGMPIQKVKELCPDCYFGIVPTYCTDQCPECTPNPVPDSVSKESSCPKLHAQMRQNIHKASLDVFRDASKSIFGRLRTHLPSLDQVSVDEAYMDLTDQVRQVLNANPIFQALRKLVLAAVQKAKANNPVDAPTELLLATAFDPLSDPSFVRLIGQEATPDKVDLLKGFLEEMDRALEADREEIDEQRRSEAAKLSQSQPATMSASGRQGEGAGGDEGRGKETEGDNEGGEFDFNFDESDDDNKPANATVSQGAVVCSQGGVSSSSTPCNTTHVSEVRKKVLALSSSDFFASLLLLALQSEHPFQCLASVQERLLGVYRADEGQSHLVPEEVMHEVEVTTRISKEAMGSLQLWQTLVADAALVLGAKLVQTAQLDLRSPQGGGWSTSGGVAHSRMLAKMVSACHKPAKVSILRHRAEMAFLRHLPVRKLPLLGGKLGKSVAKMGASFAAENDLGEDVDSDDEEMMNQQALAASGAPVGGEWARILMDKASVERSITIGELWPLPTEEIARRLKLDVPTAAFVQQRLRGAHGDSGPATKRDGMRKSVLSSKSFGQGMTTVGSLLRWVRLFASELVRRMRIELEEHDRWPRTMAVHVSARLLDEKAGDGVRMGKWVSRSRQAHNPVPHANKSFNEQCKEVVKFAFDKLSSALQGSQRWEVMLMGVAVSNFESLDKQSDVRSLFMQHATANGKPTQTTLEREAARSIALSTSSGIKHPIAADRFYGQVITEKGIGAPQVTGDGAANKGDAVSFFDGMSANIVKTERIGGIVSIRGAAPKIQAGAWVGSAGRRVATLPSWGGGVDSIAEMKSTRSGINAFFQKTEGGDAKERMVSAIQKSELLAMSRMQIMQTESKSTGKEEKNKSSKGAMDGFLNGRSSPKRKSISQSLVDDDEVVVLDLSDDDDVQVGGVDLDDEDIEGSVQAFGVENDDNPLLYEGDSTVRFSQFEEQQSTIVYPQEGDETQGDGAHDHADAPRIIKRRNSLRSPPSSPGHSPDVSPGIEILGDDITMFHATTASDKKSPKGGAFRPLQDSLDIDSDSDLEVVATKTSTAATTNARSGTAAAKSKRGNGKSNLPLTPKIDAFFMKPALPGKRDVSALAPQAKASPKKRARAVDLMNTLASQVHTFESDIVLLDESDL